MDQMAKQAEVWATENGLRGPFSTSVRVEPFGFGVELSELSGKKRSAYMTFQRDGSPSLYELTSRDR